MNLDKILSKLPQSVVEEMDNMDEEQLKNCVVQSNQAVSRALEELNKNESYLSAKQSVSDLSASTKDLKKYQNAKIAYALHILDSLSE